MPLRRDPHTLDLLDWEPPSVVATIPPESIKAPTLRDRISRAVSVVLSECDIPRADIAKRMTAFLGEDVSLHMLNAYASQAKEEQTIPAHRLAALAEATGDARVLQILAEAIDHVVVEKRYVGAIKDAMITDQIKQLERIRFTARREWKS